MSQRIHDPTESGMPECSTTGTIREKLNSLAKETAAKLSPEGRRAKPKDRGPEH